SSTARCRSASLAASRSASVNGYPASMSTCSRQLSTFERSVLTSAISVTSLTDLLWFVLPTTNPPRLCWRGAEALTEGLRLLPQRRRVEATQQLLHARLEHCALGLGVGCELVQPP